MKRKILLMLVCFAVTMQGCQSAEPPPSTQVSATAMPIPSETPTTLATEEPTTSPEFSPILLKSGYGFLAPWADLYFTDPYSPYAADENGGVDGILSAKIISAQENVDIAVNSLSLIILNNALIRAKERGVRVRVVIESDYLAANLSNLQSLIDAGIPIVGDQEKGIMDNNFIVIDNKEVWTGSIILTRKGVYHGYNNLLHIDSQQLAENYTREFDEMFVNSAFGPNVVPDTPKPIVTVEGTQIEVFFLPDDLFAARLTELLNNAQSSIIFTAASFSSEEFGNLIRKRAGENIIVSGVINNFALDPTRTSQYELFRNAGLDVRLGNPDIVLYENVLIIDSKIVIVGTYDFSKWAELTNDGNVLIIHNEAIAKKYLDEFEHIQSTSQK